MQNPYQNYMQKAGETMTPAERTAAVYDRCITELQKAVYYIDNNSIPEAHKSITKVQDIIDFLEGHLVEKYEISNSFAELYSFLRQELLTANIKKDTEKIKEIIPYFQNLKDSFTEMSKKGM
ncbi:MAG: flagellar export chaperone FliS [Oscillospiraceae bacterium]